MKKIFYILVSAIVALGAVACNNEIEENIEANRSEGVSFTASLDDNASRVLIGDLTDGKHPIAFENDDVIYASLEYDYSAPFVFTTTDGVNFTCTEANANGQLPEELIGKDVFFIVNGQKMVSGQTMNSATGVDGIFFSAEVSNFKNNSTVTLGLQDYYGVFAFTSPYDVTLEASTHIFIIGPDIRSSITIPQAEGTQYVGFMNQMGEEFTLSYSVNGKKVKEITRGYSNKIYTLGGLTEAVATVNGKNYTDLAQAVVAAAEAGEEVELSDDATVTEPITIPAGTEVTIDLNGNVITADDTTYAFNNLGTLTLKDSNAGAIPSSSSVMSKTGAEIDWSVSALGIYNGYDKDGNYVSTAKLIIESGNYQATGTNGGAAVYNYGILEVKGGYFKSNGGYGLINQATGVMTIENAEINGGIYNVGTLTVKEGTKLLQHLSGKHAIYNWEGSVTINGGEFDSLSGNELILADGTNATVTINNGTFKKTAKSWLFGAATGKNISFVINDGKFYGYVNEPEMSVDTIRPYGDPIVVKGGMFNFDPTNWLAEGFQVVANGNGTYTVKEQTYKVYVMAQPKSSYASWTKVNIYTWYKEGGKDTGIEWPGEDSTSKTAVINGYTYNYYEYPATWNGKDVYVIANNGSAQTADIHLGTLDKDYYVVYSAAIGDVYTTAPAAGSIEEYKEPEVANMYYLKPNSNWTQANARFVGYFWNGTGNVWIELTDADKDGYYECDLKEFIPTKVIFLRKDPTGFVYNNWTCWNRVGDLTIAAGKNCYTMKAGDWTQDNGSGYTGGTWSTK